MELSAVDSREDYRQYLIEFLQPGILCHKEVVLREEKLVHMILMDFLRASGLKLKLLARKPLPLHAAEVFYISEDQSQLEEDDINFELELMDEARNLFKKLNIPNSSRNRDFVYKRRSRNPLPESETGDENRIGHTIEKEDNVPNNAPKVKHEINKFMMYPPNNLNHQINEKIRKSHPHSISENL